MPRIDKRGRIRRAYTAYVDLLDAADALRERMSRQLRTWNLTISAVSCPRRALSRRAAIPASAQPEISLQQAKCRAGDPRPRRVWLHRTCGRAPAALTARGSGKFEWRAGPAGLSRRTQGSKAASDERGRKTDRPRVSAPRQRGESRDALPRRPRARVAKPHLPQGDRRRLHQILQRDSLAHCG